MITNRFFQRKWEFCAWNKCTEMLWASASKYPHKHTYTSRAQSNKMASRWQFSCWVQNILHTCTLHSMRCVVKRIETHQQQDKRYTDIQMKKSATSLQKFNLLVTKRLDENDDPTTMTPLQIGSIILEGTRGRHQHKQCSRTPSRKRTHIQQVHTYTVHN